MTTTLITGPTGGLGRSATMAMAERPAGERPDLLLVGRHGNALSAVAAEARAAGATVREIGCDLASLADVRAAAETVKELLKSGVVGPLSGLIANAGLSVVDTRSASADGYELTFAVNYLAHAQLIGDLLDSFASPVRIVLVGSNTYYAHELQRRAPEGINVAVFEPGFMPGTGLGRQQGAGVQRVARVIQRLPIPGIASPLKSGPALASVALDER
jgi:NAD(P)-dependent dehydrogenase (short-subunit alcohol dehydrogenase family)